MRDLKIKRLALGGLMAALILLLTATLKLPVAVGYVHLGDGMIFLAGLVLGPYAALSAGIGSALADLMAGYAPYILPTFLIKGTMGYLAGKYLRKASFIRQLALLFLAELIMVAGYCLFEGFLYNWAAALSAMPMNAVQGLCGVIFGLGFCALAPRLPKLEG